MNTIVILSILFGSGIISFPLPKAEKKSPKKPHRFSSCLPDSQELLNIRNKKKVTNYWQRNQYLLMFIYTYT